MESFGHTLPADVSRNEVLDCGGSLEPAEARNADAPGAADTAEDVAQDVDDHRVLRPILRAPEQLAGETPVVRSIDAAGTRSLDRIALHVTGRIDGQEGLR